ncbi:hypothetical protein AB7W58_22905 [Providencia rettgeri]
MFKVLGQYAGRLIEYLFDIMTILVVYAGCCFVFWFLFLKTENPLGENIAKIFIFIAMLVTAGKIFKQARFKKTSTSFVQFVKAVVMGLSIVFLFLFTLVALYQANGLL